MTHPQSIAAATDAPAGRRLFGACRSLHAVRLVLVVVYLVSVAQVYRPRVGFTTLIMFAGDSHEWETPTVQRTPHAHGAATGGYDGQYYAQMAIDPLLRDGAIDHALDNPPQRARRILCSAVAYAAGLGQPFWVLQAYALENVAVWLLLAWCLHRRLPVPDARSLAVWIGCLFGHGLLVSTRLALLDGPSLLIIVLAILALERGRPVLASSVMGIAGLARETNLLSLASLPVPWPPSPRRLLRAAVLVILALLPLLLWVDYLRSIYRGQALTGSTDLLWPPLAGYLGHWQATVGQLAVRGLASPARWSVLALVGVTVQAGFLVVRVRWRNPWWRLGIAYVALMLVLDHVVWMGFPGAFTRVLLPLQVAFNILALDSPGFWPIVVAGNLNVIAGLATLQVPLLSRWLQA
jgi:hypothetical protein